MTLQELYDRIGSQLKMNKHLSDCIVCVWTSDKSIGPHSSSKVNACGGGIDWDNGKYFIFPEDELTKKTN